MAKIREDEIESIIKEKIDNFEWIEEDVFKIKPKRKKAIILTGNRELLNSKSFALAVAAECGNKIDVQLYDGSQSIRGMEKLAYESIIIDEKLEKKEKPKDWYRKFEKKKWR